MGADLTRIKFIIAQRAADGKTRPFCPATDMPSLIEAAKTIKGGLQLLIIDPLVAAIGTKTNSHNNAETRNSLQPVVDFAEAANCAVLGISHFTKGTGGKDPIERVTGSLAFGALPRIVFAAAKNENGESPRQRQETPGLTVMANLHVFAILNQTAADSGIPPNESRIQGLGIRLMDRGTVRDETKLHRHLGKPLRVMEILGRANGRARDQPKGFRRKARKARNRARQARAQRERIPLNPCRHSGTGAALRQAG
jgi:hypothetical protein